ncbi:MAG: hypothetical protein Q9198_001176 [Flavoplaca austrocitrina]
MAKSKSKYSLWPDLKEPSLTPEETPKTQQRRPVYANYERLKAYLEMESVEDLKKWMDQEDGLYKPAWDQLYNDHIKGAQEQAKASGEQRRRQQDLSEVQGHLAQCELNGKHKFSRPSPDRSGWTRLDHYARFVWWVAKENTEDQNGIFYGKGLSDDIIHQRVWMVLQRSNQNNTPSHKPASHPPERHSQRLRAQGASGPSGQSGESTSSTSTATAAKRKQPSDGLEVEFSDSAEDSEDVEVLEGAEPEVPSNGLVPSSTLFLSRKAKAERDRLSALENDVEIPPGFKGAKFQPLAAEEKLKLARRSDVPNISDPYWMYVLVVRLCNAYGEHIQAKKITEEMFESYKVLSAESIAWAGEIEAMMEEPDIKLRTPCNATTNKFNELHSMMDNVAFQRDDYAGACKRLGIVDPQHPRLRSMPRGKELFFWQVIGVDTMVEWQSSSSLRGMVLGDDMGLGKTITIGAFLARQQELRQDRLKNGEDVPKAQPTLVVVPANLVDQWIKDLDFVMPDVPIFLYYGHKKNRKYGGNVCVMDTNLTKRHALFNGDEKNSRAIILTSSATLARRHGPNAQYRWRTVNEKWKPKVAQEKMNDLDSDSFPYALNGMFAIVVVDEAHVAKNIETATHQTILWLDASFIIPATATPVINHVRDYTGLINLIQKRGQWHPANLQRLGVSKHVDPYADSYDDDDEEGLNKEIRDLRCTTVAYHRLVAECPKPALAGHRLEKAYAMSMLRRTYMSRVPFSTGTQIGDIIPPTVTTTLETAFELHEQEMYDPLAQQLRSRLAKKLENGKIVWNAKNFRQLVLLGTWLGFAHCQHHMGAQRTKALLADPFTISRLVDMCTAQDPDTWPAVDRNDKPHLIAAVLRGAPKLRALLKVVSHQVLVLKEKAIIWVTFPAQQVLITLLLRLTGVDARALHAGLEYDEKRELVSDFSESATKVPVLVPCYAVGSYGYNFQHQNHNVHCFDPAPSDPIENQAIHRSRRLGQKWYVIVVRYYLAKSFNDFHTSNNIRKAIPGVMATLNDRLISKDSDGDDIEVDMGSWCLDFSNELVPVASVPLEDMRFIHRLSPQELVEEIIKATHGEVVVVDEPQDPFWLKALEHEGEEEDLGEA